MPPPCTHVCTHTHTVAATFIRQRSFSWATKYSSKKGMARCSQKQSVFGICVVLVFFFLIKKKKNVISLRRHIRLSLITVSPTFATLKTRNCVIWDSALWGQKNLFPGEKVLSQKNEWVFPYVICCTKSTRPADDMVFQVDSPVPGGSKLALQISTPIARLHTLVS